jgi:hypothetical protein
MTRSTGTTDGEVVGGSTDWGGPDYDSVDTPDEPRTEWSYVERRAELLQLIREAGHPRALNQTRLADRYGVSQQQISKDFDRLAEYRRAVVTDRDRRMFALETTVERAIRGLLEEEEWRKAAKTAMEWEESLREYHDLEELAERLRLVEERQDSEDNDPINDLTTR